MGELMGCPFCGGEAEIFSSRNPIVRYPQVKVRCKDCCCQTDGYIIYPGTSGTAKEAEAVAAWNRRAGGWVKEVNADVD